MSELSSKWSSYPTPVAHQLQQLREWMYSVVAEHDLGEITESLKWGEPSFQTKTGSMVRMDWKPSDPEHYRVFVHCQTRLIETYRELYGDLFHFEGNRAIVFRMDEQVPVDALKHCLLLAFRYHKIKHLPMLGA